MKYWCPTCGYVYDESVGFPNGGIPAGTRWDRLPGHWVCPRCRARKLNFIPQQSAFNAPPRTNGTQSASVTIEDSTRRENMHEMSFGELSALCSSLAYSCERQYLQREAQQFTILADYYKVRTPPPADAAVDNLLALMEQDLSAAYASADAAAEAANDRGAKRMIRWSKGVTRTSSATLTRYKSQGDSLLQNTKVFICEICGFIHIGGALPPVCPICRVHDFRFSQVE